MMTCTLPQRIADRDLLAYLDGEASPQVVQHLAGCTDCRQRAAKLAQQESHLLAAFYRRECPTSQELGEYHLQLLPTDRARGILQHVTGCRLCAQELADLKSYLAALRSDVERGVFEEAGARVRVWIARLVGGVAGAGLPAHLAPAAVGVRGSDEGPHVYEADGLQVSIEVQAEFDQAGRRGLFGLLLGADPAEFQAHLWQRGTRITSVPVDGLGNFVISDLELGSYELILERPGVEVHVQDLAVV